jgi:hypothetical protein
LLLVDMMRGPIYISFLIVRSDDRENNRDVIQQSKGEKKAAIRRGVKKRTAIAHRQSSEMLIVAS